MTVRLKRAYEEPAKSDGLRILVERLWPRGLSKEAAAIDVWLKQVAPSTELRKWFGHDPEKWKEFQKRYRKELALNKSAVTELKQHCRGKTVTLVFAAKDEDRNSAVVLKSYLSKADR